MRQERPGAPSKKQSSSNKHDVFKLLAASFLSGEQDAFKAHLESNPIRSEWFDEILRHGIKLVTKKKQTISDITPTLKILLKYGAKKNFYDHTTPYHIICLDAGDNDEILDFAIKELGKSLINAKDSINRTALLCAVLTANIECVERLIEHGANMNIVSDNYLHQEVLGSSLTPLTGTIKLMDRKCHFPDIMMTIFDLLLDSGADVNQPCSSFYKRTPIMYAAELGITYCVQKLIQEGACIYTEDNGGRPGWTFVASTGNVDMLKCLLEDGDFDKNEVDKDRLSVLHWALQSRKIQAVHYLLNLGVTLTTDIPQECVDLSKFCGTNLRYDFMWKKKLTSDPYMEAIRLNMPEVVKLMEEFGCQLNKCAEALFCAIKHNSVEVVEYLLCNHKYPLNIKYTEYDFWRVIPSGHHTLLTKACQHRSVKIVKLLLEHGADPNTWNIAKKSCSTIIEAICEGHVEVIALFIRSGVNVNDKSFHPGIDFVLPFEAAVYENNIYAAEMLLVTGCSRGVHSLDNNHKHKVDSDPDLQKLIKEWNVHKNNVLPLKQRCRMVILNHLSPQADKKITKLPLPSSLIKYLSIPELDDIIEACKSNPRPEEYVI